MSAIDDVLKMAAGTLSSVVAQKAGRSLLGSGGRRFMGDVGRAMAGGAGVAIAGTAVAGAGIAAQQIYNAMTKARDFRSMLGSSFNADLHEFYQARPKQFNEAFSSLRSVNPEFTKDPMIAGTYMRRVMSFDPAGAGNVMEGALLHRKDVGPGREGPMSEAFLGGAATGAAKGMEQGQRERFEQGKSEHQHALGLRQNALRNYMDKGKGPSEEMRTMLTGEEEPGPFFRGEDLRKR